MNINEHPAIKNTVWADVLQIRRLEQTECFMLLLNCPIDGPCSTFDQNTQSSKTVFATHP